jgi:hypothetical protein
MSQPLTLRVETDYFVAGAIFEKIYGVWSCVRAAPILRWMIGKSPKEIHTGLLKMGADYDWLSADGSLRREKVYRRLAPFPTSWKPSRVEGRLSYPKGNSLNSQGQTKSQLRLETTGQLDRGNDTVGA